MCTCGAIKNSHNIIKLQLVNCNCGGTYDRVYMCQRSTLRFDSLETPREVNSREKLQTLRRTRFIPDNDVSSSSCLQLEDVSAVQT